MWSQCPSPCLHEWTDGWRSWQAVRLGVQPAEWQHCTRGPGADKPRVSLGLGATLRALLVPTSVCVPVAVCGVLHAVQALGREQQRD